MSSTCSSVGVTCRLRSALSRRRWRFSRALVRARISDSCSSSRAFFRYKVRDTLDRLCICDLRSLRSPPVVYSLTDLHHISLELLHHLLIIHCHLVATTQYCAFGGEQRILGS
ncbi:hypothetical protein MHYP_G00251500 [Metynnis hypsauchen]